LQLKYDESLSIFAFSFNLRRYNKVVCPGCNAVFHASCLGFYDGEAPEDDWFCPLCADAGVAEPGAGVAARTAARASVRRAAATAASAAAAARAILIQRRANAPALIHYPTRAGGSLRTSTRPTLNYRQYE